MKQNSLEKKLKNKIEKSENCHQKERKAASQLRVNRFIKNINIFFFENGNFFYKIILFKLCNVFVNIF